MELCPLTCADLWWFGSVQGSVGPGIQGNWYNILPLCPIRLSASMQRLNAVFPMLTPEIAGEP